SGRDARAARPPPSVAADGHAARPWQVGQSGQLRPALDRRTNAPNTITPSASAQASHAMRWKWRCTAGPCPGKRNTMGRGFTLEGSMVIESASSDQFQQLAQIGTNEIG